MTETTVTELRWAKDVYPPVGTDTTSWIPCTTTDGAPAALALDDEERESLGAKLLYLDRADDVADDQFFEAGRLYTRDGVTFRCEGLAPYPGATELRAFGFQRQGHPTAAWTPAMLSERSWRKGWEDVTCPEHGYECAPHAPVPDCTGRR
ncbi:hypothetical protein [Streptomyces sp. NPDC058084]|uniref:hypothetical protein n=1 Tax=Streptomyces sp. NPDC058084 TaxID=3346333 RepID=UPI0036DFCA11